MTTERGLLTHGMGELRQLKGSEARKLLNQHLVGRSPECALRLSKTYVSSQHALIRWHGRGWEVLDRGSRNGTRVDGEPVAPGEPHRLKKGSILSFGHPDECWVLADASAPDAMLVALDDGQVLSGAQGLIGVPSSAAPELTLYRDIDDTWKLELADGTTRTLSDGETLESGGRLFRLSLPSANEATASVGGTSLSERPSLRFSVSSDEEFVELELEFGARRVPLGSRAHNYLLLTLARALLKDREAGVAEAACGWLEKGELARGLSMSPEQIDGEVFRVRRHFARHGLREAAVIIERRPRTKQIRLGLSDVLVERR
jgi:hypothetical protein